MTSLSQRSASIFWLDDNHPLEHEQQLSVNYKDQEAAYNVKNGSD